MRTKKIIYQIINNIAQTGIIFAEANSIVLGFNLSIQNNTSEIGSAIYLE